MAKINRRTSGGGRTSRVGPTLFTERTRPADKFDVARVYYEAWRLRSDGMLQSRIVKTWAADGSENETKHHSAFRNIGYMAAPTIEVLRRNLERKGFKVVKEQW